MLWLQRLKKRLTKNPIEGLSKKKASKKMKRDRKSRSPSKIVSMIPAGIGAREPQDDSYSTMSLSDDLSEFDCPCPPLHLEPSKRKYEIAIVACGEFWNPQRRFQRLEGVKRVIAGYTGGGYDTPSAEDLQDQTRALFIEYNPRKISYGEILQMWADNDFPWEEDDWSNRSALFVMNQEQRGQAIGFLSMLAMTRPKSELHVDVEPATTFYQAEEYQQDYLGKHVRASKEQFLLWANDAVPTGLCPILE